MAIIHEVTVKWFKVLDIPFELTGYISLHWHHHLVKGLNKFGQFFIELLGYEFNTGLSCKHEMMREEKMRSNRCKKLVTTIITLGVFFQLGCASNSQSNKAVIPVTHFGGNLPSQDKVSKTAPQVSSIDHRDTFGYVYIGDSHTTEAEAKYMCVERANKKARTFSNVSNIQLKVLNETVEYIENIVTVECQVQVVSL